MPISVSERRTWSGSPGPRRALCRPVFVRRRTNPECDGRSRKTVHLVLSFRKPHLVRLAAANANHRTHSRIGALPRSVGVDGPILRPEVARRITRGVLLGLALIQVAIIAALGNSLPPHGIGDAYGEADAIRSAEYYATHGFQSHAGLPTILYGTRFADDGWLGDLRHPRGQNQDATPLPDGVYTRYPPLANWIAGLSEKMFGFRRLWAWRTVPVATGLLALLCLVRLLAKSIGEDRAALMAIGVAVIPMTSGYMSALHYEGFAQALLLVQLGLLVSDYSRYDRIRTSTLLFVGVCAFVQGFLSFDYAFVVTFSAVPLWLFRRAENRAIHWRSLISPILIAGLGFTLAHALHFTEVAHFYGSWRTAGADLIDRARYRAVGAVGDAYLINLLFCAQTYVEVVLDPTNYHFGPALFLALVFCALLTTSPALRVSRARRGTELVVVGGRQFAGGVIAGLVVSTMWYAAMPRMSFVHTHIVPRLLFLAYFCALLAIVKSLRAATAVDNK